MQVSYNYQPSQKKSKKKSPSSHKGVRVSRNGSFQKKRRWPKILAALCILIAGGSILFVALIGWYSQNLPNPNRLIDRALPQSTKIYDRTDKVLLYQFHGAQQRTLVTLDEIPENLKHAAITAEDRNFYTHKGVDFKGILRAIFVDLLRGGKLQGGSTITQQLIKNALLTSEKSLVRKLKELILAYQIEHKFTKDQILQMYFNEIPYGSIVYGARAASLMYFGKDVKELDLAESAILAVLPRAPTYYSPWGKNRDKLIVQQHVLLDSMVQEGYISAPEAEDAKKEKLIFKNQNQSLLAPHFVMYVRELLTETYGAKLVEEGGLTVTTTLDYEKQKNAEETVSRWAEKNTAFGASNAAMVSIDAHTGEILAMVGSKDYFDESIDGNVNVTTRPRQPGSSFKPIVYAAAFKKGYTPSTIVFDLKTNFDTTGQKPYEPQNYSLKEYGPVTMKKSIAGSLNVASVKTLYLTGVSTVIDLAKDLGYTTLQDPSRYGLALVLGGGEVTLLEHTAAFSAFAREGVRVQPASIIKVSDSRGSTLQEFEKKSIQTSLDIETAREINDVLSDQSAREYIFGKSNYLQLSGRQAAIKTGTTNDFRDAWTIGYTPSIVTGVWVGNNDNTAMKKGADGSKLAAPIWNEYMKKTLGNSPAEAFQKPLPVTTGKGILDGTIGQGIVTTFDAATGEIANNQTPADRLQEKITGGIHDTLFYINREDPRGPIPQHPEQDPQFDEWERVVREWVAKNNISDAAPSVVSPTPTQNTNPLSLSIDYPKENDTITNTSLPISVTVNAPKGIAKVEYYIDSKLLGTTTTSPFSLSIELSGIDDGFRTLRVKAFDKGGATNEAHMNLNILLKK